MDGDAQQQRVQDIVKRATSERQQQLDPELLREIKRHCKSNDDSLRTVFETVLVAIKSRHSQQRLLGLEIADALFTRSKLFRGMLAPQLTYFLAKTVGFRSEDPLPPPVACAEALRQRALLALEEWNSKFGGLYHQVAMGYAYLRNTLDITFPDAAATAAAAQAEEQQAAEDTYRRIDVELPGAFREMDDSVTQLKEALAVAEAPLQTAAAAAAEEQEMGWTDAIPTDAPGDGEGGGHHEEGLHGYGAEDASAFASTGSRDEMHADVAADPAVGEAIAGCARLLATRHLPLLQSWLDAYSRVSSSGSDSTARDPRVQEAMRRRGDITCALAAIDSASVRVPGLAAALDAAAATRTPDAQSAQGAEEPSEGGATSHTICRSSSRRGGRRQRGRQLSDSPTAEEDAQLVATARRHAALKHAAAPASSWALDNRFAGKSAPVPSPAQRLAAEASISNAQPAVRTAAPTRAGAAEAHPGAAAASASTRPTLEGRGAVGEGAGGHVIKGAPEVTAGGHLQYWDSAAAATTTNAGMEISNHWGAIDNDAQAALSQLEGKAVNHVAQYYTPQAREIKQARGKGGFATSAASPTAGEHDKSSPHRVAPSPLSDRSTVPPRESAVTHIGPPRPMRLTPTTVRQTASAVVSDEAVAYVAAGIPSNTPRNDSEFVTRELRSAASPLKAPPRDATPRMQEAQSDVPSDAAYDVAYDVAIPALSASPGRQAATAVDGGTRIRLGASGSSGEVPRRPAREEAMHAAGDDVTADVTADVATRVHQMMSAPGGVSAFNSAILGGAATDEDVERALGDAGRGGSSVGGARKRKATKQPQTAAKLKQLLSSKRSSGPKHSIPGKGHTWFR